MSLILDGIGSSGSQRICFDGVLMDTRNSDLCLSRQRSDMPQEQLADMFVNLPPAAIVRRRVSFNRLRPWTIGAPCLD